MAQRAPDTAEMQAADRTRVSDDNFLVRLKLTVGTGTNLSKETLEVVLLEPISRYFQTFFSDGRRDAGSVRPRPSESRY